MPYIRKIIRSGAVLEIEEYFYPDSAKKPRRSQQSPNRESRKETQYQVKLKKLTRLINSNFAAKDLFVTLSYEESVSREQGKRDLQNFFRRLKRLRKKQGLPPLKYISVTEGGEDSGKRVHHHIVINKMSWDDVRNVWGKGHVRIEDLYTVPDYESLASYISKEPKTKNENSWNRSHNLKPPIIEKIRIKRNNKSIRLPKEYSDYRVTVTDNYANVSNGSVKYLKAIAPGGHDYAQGRIKDEES